MARMDIFCGGEERNNMELCLLLQIRDWNKILNDYMENISKLFSFQKNIYSNFKVAFSCQLPSFH